MLGWLFYFWTALIFFNFVHPGLYIWFGHNMFILQYIILGVQNLCVTTLLANCGNYCSASHNAWWQIFETKDQAILFTIKTGFEFPKMAHCKLKIWSILTWKLKCVRVHVAGERQICTFTYSTVLSASFSWKLRILDVHCTVYSVQYCIV